MSRNSMRGRHPCSSSSGSASYQGVSGAASPIYHMPHDPPYHNDLSNNIENHRKKSNNTDNHSYYNIHTNNSKLVQDCCVKSTTTETPSYQYVDDRKDYRTIDNNFTDDDSGSSSRFQPYYEQCSENRREKRHINNQFSEYDSDFPIAHAGKNKYQDDWHQNNTKLLGFDKINVKVLTTYDTKERNKISNQDNLRGLDRVYPAENHQVLNRHVPDIDFHHGTLPRHDATRLSERAHSPGVSSIATSAVVDGCGGHCVTFENICSYILQIFFVMGILIGVSLVIAGTILRRTKARDLQVLVYIGAMSAMVCTLLLTVQCRVRRGLRKRKRTIRVACTAIPMGEMRPVQQPLIHLPSDNNRVQMPVQVNCPVSHNHLNHNHNHNQIINQRHQDLPDQQGIPWWRRTDVR